MAMSKLFKFTYLSEGERSRIDTLISEYGWRPSSTRDFHRMIEDYVNPLRKLRLSLSLLIFFSSGLLYFVPSFSGSPDLAIAQTANFILHNFPGSLIIGAVFAIVMWVLVSISIRLGHDQMVLRRFLKIDDLSRQKSFLQDSRSRKSFASEIQRVTSTLSRYTFPSSSKLPAQLEKLKDPTVWDKIPRITIQRIAGATVRGVYDGTIYQKKMTNTQRLEPFKEFIAITVTLIAAVVPIIIAWMSSR